MTWVFPDDPAEAAEVRALLDHALDTLTFREREIMKLRYGYPSGYTHTYEEIGRRFKVTRERVRQIILKAIRKLGHPVRAKIIAEAVGYTYERMKVDEKNTKEVLLHPDRALKKAKRMLKKSKAAGDGVGVRAWEFQISLLKRRVEKS